MGKEELFEKLSVMADLKMDELKEYVNNLSDSEASMIASFCDIISEHCRERLFGIKD